MRLEQPSTELGDSYRGLVREFVELGEDLVPFPLSFPHHDMSELVANLAAYSRGDDLQPGFVAHSTYWLVDSSRNVVGVSNLRHSLTAALRRYGGSIGYGVRPSARGQGFGTEILRQTLVKAHSMGLSELLLVCAKDNRASVSVIVNNGGVLDSEEFLPEEGEVIHRYWIRLPELQEAGEGR